ncbi:hypothetical protein [Bradyrhizobium vignae]|uniref:hypothetical protein n=1 Tax=Bradyrhizobium vignae TaxID=1549949 RepID=UPI0013598814|nr:hypothetical protein [Bradyrhizobium vignae]
MLVYLPPFLSASLGVSADTGGIVMLAATLPMLFVPPLGAELYPRSDGDGISHWLSRS